MVKIDILDIIEELYNVENSNIFIENYLKNETMFDEENPVNKRVRAIEDLSNNSKNIVEKYIKSCKTVVNTGATGGYVHNTVDKLFTNVKNQGVINNFDPMEENINEIQKVCSTEKDFIPQIVKNIGVTSPIFQSMEKSFIGHSCRETCERH